MKADGVGSLPILPVCAAIVVVGWFYREEAVCRTPDPLPCVDLAAAQAKLSAMGAIRPPRPVNLICGFISNDVDLIARAIRLLSEHVGPTDEVSEIWPFDFTDYYEAEMGENLQRQFASFARLIDPVEMAAIKILTNQIEARLCDDLALPTDRRVVNLDPGYITTAKLVLATTKDFGHRVYLRDGIYAESTLHYIGNRWEPWPWTYPDYAGPRYHPFFERVRERFKEKLTARESAAHLSQGLETGPIQTRSNPGSGARFTPPTKGGRS